MEFVKDMQKIQRELAEKVLKKTDFEFLIRNSKKKIDADDLIRYCNGLYNLQGYVNSMMESLDDIENFLMAKMGDLEIQIENLTTGRYTFETNQEYMLEVAGHKPGFSWADEAEEDQYVEELHRKIEKMCKFSTAGSGVKQKKVIQKYENHDFGMELQIPIVKSLEQIPPCMYFYDSRDLKESGIYINMGEKLYIKVPMPDLDTANIPKGVTRCKNNTLNECAAERPSSIEDQLARRSKKIIKSGCNFLHSGDKMKKIGSESRCFINPTFGSIRNLPHDVEKTPESDIRTMLTYSLSDLLLAAVWFQKHDKNNEVMKDIDTIK